LLQYINIKTKSANRGSKSRGSFANLYALYILVEDYIQKGYLLRQDYSKYDGAEFSVLFKRQRELPFGAKLQNHALNNRVNSEYQSFFPNSDLVPIIRNLETNRYWINENLLKVNIAGHEQNIAESVIDIIDEYISTKKNSFEQFIKQCLELKDIKKENVHRIEEFISDLLAPNVDARLFEIASFSILKYFYKEIEIFWGYSVDELKKDSLHLYKTGRTNANDGGIDFVMKPLGRFFQVTETLDFKKYFLDIDKIHRYPISFVIKSENNEENILAEIRNNAKKVYPIESIVEKYMASIDEIINIPKLKLSFQDVVQNGMLENVLEEIILQSKVEFNYNQED
jgi:hypothetical protein